MAKLVKKPSFRERQERQSNPALAPVSPSRKIRSPKPLGNFSPSPIRQSPSLLSKLRNENCGDLVDFHDSVGHSPPKIRKTETKRAIRQLDFSNVGANDDDTMDVVCATTDDLACRIDRMVVTQLGGRRKRRIARRKQNQDAESDEESEQEEPPGHTRHKRLKDEFNLKTFAGVMNSVDEKHCQRSEQELPKMFDEWEALFHYGHFNILITGIGSKTWIINKFLERDIAASSNVFVVNGCSQTVTLRSVLSSIEQKLKLKISGKKTDVIHGARALGKCIAAKRVDVIIAFYSIDGNNLRDPAQQNMFANFVDASEGFVHVIASIDHMNASQIWCPETSDLFGWVTYPVSTFSTYKKEILASASAFIDRKTAAENHTFASLDVFWNALPVSAQKELQLLATMCLSEDSLSIDVNALFDAAKLKMISSSKSSLIHHLTEFKDHYLISFSLSTIRLLIDGNLLLSFIDTKDMEVD